MFFKNISQSLQRIEELLSHLLKRSESLETPTRSFDLPCEVKVQSLISKYEVSINNVFYDFFIYQGLNGKLYCSLPFVYPSVDSLYDSVRSDVGIVDRFARSFRFSLVQECGKEELLSKAILYFIEVLNASQEQVESNGGTYAPPPFHLTGITPAMNSHLIKDFNEHLEEPPKTITNKNVDLF